MKAAVLSRIEGLFEIEEISNPQPKAGEVLVKVAACGVCHTDLHVLKGDIKFPLPAVMGHEISGIVEEIAPGVTHVKPGDRVVASFIMPCATCEHCVRGRDDLCETFFQMNRLRGVLYDGTSRLTRRNGTPLAMYSMGGLAQYAVVPVTDVFRLPDSLPLEDACILGCAVMTAYGAVCHQAEIKPGESVAVVGVGGIGSNVIQFAQLFGAGEIIAVDVRDEKLAAARALGATRTINATHGDPATLVRELTSNRGVDCAFEALGRPETALQAFSMARDGGRAVLIGVANGSAAVQIPITQLVRRGIRLIGSYGGRVRTDIPQLIRLLETGRLDISRTISRRFQLSKVNDAFRALENGEIVGRALIAMN